MVTCDIAYSPPAIVEIEAELDRAGIGHIPATGASVVHRRPAPARSADLASWIEHTLLRPAATPAEIDRLCDEARKHCFLGVCVNPIYVEQAHDRLSGSGCKIVSVVGFPLGATFSTVKAREADLAVLHGAHEVDMVLAVGALKDERFTTVYDDIRMVVKAAAPAPVKVIIETALLDDEDKIVACLIAVRAGAAFVKTSTGFTSGGATVDDVRLMHAAVGDAVGIKAAGGIRTAAFARQLIEAGATRLGCSASVAMVTELP